MSNIGALELLVIAAIGLIVIGPERLPEVVRSVAEFSQRLRLYGQQLYAEFKQKSGINEIQQDLHNESVLRSLEKKNGGGKK